MSKVIRRESASRRVFVRGENSMTHPDELSLAMQIYSTRQSDIDPITGCYFIYFDIKPHDQSTDPNINHLLMQSASQCQTTVRGTQSVTAHPRNVNHHYEVIDGPPHNVNAQYVEIIIKGQFMELAEEVLFRIRRLPRNVM